MTGTIYFSRPAVRPRALVLVLAIAVLGTVISFAAECGSVPHTPDAPVTREAT